MRDVVIELQPLLPLGSRAELVVTWLEAANASIKDAIPLLATHPISEDDGVRLRMMLDGVIFTANVLHKTIGDCLEIEPNGNADDKEE